MSIEAIEAVIDLIELGAVSTQADIVKCLRSALKEPESKREWVGLTDDEIYEAYLTDTDMSLETDWVLQFGSALEAKLKEKNA